MPELPEVKTIARTVKPLLEEWTIRPPRLLWKKNRAAPSPDVFTSRDVHVSFVHAVFSRNAAERLAALPVKQYIATDTVPLPPDKLKHFGKRLTILSIAPLLGEVILRAHQGRSVSEMFNE